MKLIIKEKSLQEEISSNTQFDMKLYDFAELYNEKVSFEQVDRWVQEYGKNIKEKDSWFKTLKESEPGYYRIGDIVKYFRLYDNKK